MENNGTVIELEGLEGLEPNKGSTPSAEELAAKANAEAAAKLEAENAAKKLAADTELANKYGGVKLDEKGNVLDATGKIVKTVEELNNNNGGGNAPEAVEIDGVKYRLDENGNALDSNNKVFKTKEELDSMINAQEPLVETFIKQSGYNLVDDKGNPLVFEDTEEGMVQAALAVADAKAKKAYETFIKSDPEFEEFIEHKKRGGTLNDFIQKKTNSWKAIQLDENNETQLMNAVIADLTASGMSDDEAKLTAELYKDTKKLKDFGKSAYNRLVAYEVNQEKIEKENFEASQKLYLESTKKHWDSVNEIITKKGIVNNVVIPESERESFYKYIALSADDKGNSQRTLDLQKLPLEQSLQLDYLIFKGLDLNKLVQTAVKKNNVISLRERLKGNSGAGGGEGINKDKYKPKNTSGEDISLETII